MININIPIIYCAEHNCPLIFNGTETKIKKMKEMIILEYSCIYCEKKYKIKIKEDD